MGTAPVYEGVAETLDEAIGVAHDQIPPREGRDYSVSRVVEIVMQRGGFTGARHFVVRVVEDPHAPFHSTGNKRNKTS